MAANTQTDTLRHMMFLLLTSPAAKQIDFTLDRFHVDGLGLMFVAIALLSKPQGKQHGFQIRVVHLKADSEATYDPANNTFSFPSATYGTTQFQRATIIHECVHALRDVYGKKIPTSRGRVTTRALTDEAAAFLAEALFHVYDTTATGIAPQTPYWATGSGIAGLAHGVAVRISNQQGAAVDGQYAKALRDAVMKHPAYKSFKKDPKETYGNDGVSL